MVSTKPKKVDHYSFNLRKLPILSFSSDVVRGVQAQRAQASSGEAPREEIWGVSRVSLNGLRKKESARSLKNIKQVCLLEERNN